MQSPGWKYALNIREKCWVMYIKYFCFGNINPNDKNKYTNDLILVTMIVINWTGICIHSLAPRDFSLPQSDFALLGGCLNTDLFDFSIPLGVFPLQLGHLADAFIQSELHPLLHTLTDRRKGQPCKATASSSGAVRVKFLAQGGISTQLGGAGDRTCNLSVTRQLLLLLS